MLGWDQYGIDKKCMWTRYAELLFLHLVGYAGHVVDSSASRSRNVDAIFFMLGWDQYGSHQKRTGSRYVKLLCFACSGMCGSRIAFRCVRA
jgi:hypothetical protein